MTIREFLESKEDVYTVEIYTSKYDYIGFNVRNNDGSFKQNFINTFGNIEVKNYGIKHISTINSDWTQGKEYTRVAIRIDGRKLPKRYRRNR